MSAPVQNTGDAAVFFDTADPASATLIAAQVDPSQPQVQGLSRVSNPLISDRHLRDRLANFDSEQFDLSESSHLKRLLTALLSGAGAGGLRKQQILARMSVALSGTHFLDLDGFWGALFGLTRAPEEAIPLDEDGTPLDPSTDVADSATWDVASGRDARYRARIEQLARGFAQGGTYEGIRKAASAVLNSDVEIVESWLYADLGEHLPPNSNNTWTSVSLQYGNWGNLTELSWGELATGVSLPVQVPLGNRGEVIIVPERQITAAERLQLHQVLTELLPASTMLSISASPYTSKVTVPIRQVHADSEAWSVVSMVHPRSTIDTGGQELYPASSTVEAARPAFSQYAGERWSYNGRVANVTSYAMDEGGTQLGQVDYQTVVFADGNRHDYLPSDALVDSQTLARARAASEAVLTTFPYPQGRF